MHRLVDRTARIRSFALACAFIAGCATNPYTNRSQLLLTSPTQEIQLGSEAYQQVLQDPNVTVSKDPREVEPVLRVADRIIAAAKQSKYQELAQRFDWSVTVIKDDKTLNAFALPGGKIAVYTGIFSAAKDEAGLAAIMGHEVVHALARHGGERMSQQLGAQAALITADILLGSKGASAATRQVTMEALGLGAQVGFILPFGREHESEADYIGLLLAAQAGYDPRAAVEVWQRMEKLGGEQPLEFLSTHPSHGTRIADLQDAMPEALRIYEKAPKAPAGELPAIGR